jgi:hypothetical protein
MRPLVARCRLGLGLLWRDRADNSRARADLTEAERAFREMAMPLWQESVESALKTLS